MSQQHFAVRGAEIYGPFDTRELAVEYSHAWEQIRHPLYAEKFTHLPAGGWHTTQIKSPEVGYQDALDHKRFDQERTDHQRELNHGFTRRNRS